MEEKEKLVSQIFDLEKIRDEYELLLDRESNMKQHLISLEEKN